MRSIHDHPEWPSFLWNMEALSAPLAAVRFRQGLLLGRLRTLDPDLQSEASLSTLTDDVVHSCAIGDQALPHDQVRGSLAHHLGLPATGLPSERRDVEGAVAVTLDATQRHTKPLTKDRLLGWHASLLQGGHRGTNDSGAGAWRTTDAGAARLSGAGKQKRGLIHAPAADRIESEMTMFLDWFNSAPSIDPVLVAGTAHLWFMTIRPFTDGNGRIARAITDMALARADGSHPRFYSMSTRMHTERKACDQRLETTQRGDLDISPWLEWFIACLDRAIIDADTALAPVLQRADFWQRAHRHPLHHRQRQVLQRMSGTLESSLTNSRYAALAKCSPDSALRDIRQLVQWGLLARNASGGRSTSYRLAP